MTAGPASRSLALWHVAIGTLLALLCLAAQLFLYVFREAFVEGVLTSVFTILPTPPEMTVYNFIFVILLWILLLLVGLLVTVVLFGLILAAAYVAPCLGLLGLWSIVGGVGLLRQRRWSITMLRVAAYLYLLVIPLGTVMGIVTLMTLPAALRELQEGPLSAPEAQLGSPTRPGEEA